MSDVQELSYDAYEARQRAEVAREGLTRRAAALAFSGRFRWDGAAWTPQPYPGYAFQAMASATEANAPTVSQLTAIQAQIVTALPAGQLYPLPPASFHQTVINTFSAQRRETHLIAAGLEGAFPHILEEALGHEPAPVTHPVAMQLLGVSFFRTALGALGVFAEPEHFERVLALRDRAYNHPRLRKIGLARTRPFIGHITLAYVGEGLEPSGRERLIETVASINAAMGAQPLPYLMPTAALHRYDTLAAFTRPSGYPQLAI